jgi:1-deoxyxylulose-5-phosphate synthase
MHAWQFCKALYLADLNGWTRFISMQNHYNLIYREEEREMMGLCASEHIGVIPWSPLARGRLARPWEEQSASDRAGKDEFGKTLYTKSVDSDRQVIDRVGEIAAARKVPRAQIALAWMLSKPYVTSPIIGATKQQHLDDAIAALALKLSTEEIGRLEEPYVPHPVSGFA